VRAIALVLALGLVSPRLSAQEAGPDIQHYVSMIDAGQADKVKAEIPLLLSRYPNNPGVLYLQGLTASDGAEAVRIYQSIVDNFPKSEWADDALYRVYQFYYALGLYKTAELKLSQLKQDYPDSRYLREPDKTDIKGLTDEPTPPVPASRETASSGLVYDSAARTTQTAAVAAPQKQSLTPGGSFALQVGAYTAQANADRQKSFFEGLGYTVDVISKMKDNRLLILVVVGSFPSYEAAKSEAGEIKKKYSIQCIVITR